MHEAARRAVAKVAAPGAADPVAASEDAPPAERLSGTGDRVEG
jgi:hypothetical protein